MRLKSKDYKAERSAMKSHDEIIQIKHLYSRLQHIKKNYFQTYGELVQKEYTELRVVKTILNSGAEESLITNLTKDAGVTIPRYVAPRVFVTKSVHMTNHLDQMARDFSKKNNISQRELWPSRFAGSTGNAGKRV